MDRPVRVINRARFHGKPFPTLNLHAGRDVPAGESSHAEPARRVAQKAMKVAADAVSQQLIQALAKRQFLAQPEVIQQLQAAMDQGQDVIELGDQLFAEKGQPVVEQVATQYAQDPQSVRLAGRQSIQELQAARGGMINDAAANAAQLAGEAEGSKETHYGDIGMGVQPVLQALGPRLHGAAAALGLAGAIGGGAADYRNGTKFVDRDGHAVVSGSSDPAAVARLRPTQQVADEIGANGAAANGNVNLAVRQNQASNLADTYLNANSVGATAQQLNNPVTQLAGAGASAIGTNLFGRMGAAPAALMTAAGPAIGAGKALYNGEDPGQAAAAAVPSALDQGAQYAGLRTLQLKGLGLAGPSALAAYDTIKQQIFNPRATDREAAIRSAQERSGTALGAGARLATDVGRTILGDARGLRGSTQAVIGRLFPNSAAGRALQEADLDQNQADAGNQRMGTFMNQIRQDPVLGQLDAASIEQLARVANFNHENQDRLAAAGGQTPSMAPPDRSITDPEQIALEGNRRWRETLFGRSAASQLEQGHMPVLADNAIRYEDNSLAQRMPEGRDWNTAWAATRAPQQPQVAQVNPARDPVTNARLPAGQTGWWQHEQTWGTGPLAGRNMQTGKQPAAQQVAQGANQAVQAAQAVPPGASQPYKPVAAPKPVEPPTAIKPVTPMPAGVATPGPVKA